RAVHLGVGAGLVEGRHTAIVYDQVDVLVVGTAAIPDVVCVAPAGDGPARIGVFKPEPPKPGIRTIYHELCRARVSGIVQDGGWVGWVLPDDDRRSRRAAHRAHERAAIDAAAQIDRVARLDAIRTVAAGQRRREVPGSENGTCHATRPQCG